MAKDIFDIDNNDSKDLFSSRDSANFNKKAEMRNSSGVFDYHSYSKGGSGNAGIKNLLNSKHGKNTDRNVSAGKKTAKKGNAPFKSIPKAVKIILFIFIAVNVLGRRGFLKNLSFFNKEQEMKQSIEIADNAEDAVETATTDDGLKDDITDILPDDMTTGDSEIDKIIAKRASLFNEDCRRFFHETKKEYAESIFNKINDDIKKSNISVVKERLKAEEKDLLIGDEAAFDCLSSYEDGRSLCIADAVNNDYSKVFEYRDNSMVEETLNKMLPISAIKADNADIITIYSIHTGLSQSFNIEQNVNEDNKIVINGLYNNSLDKSFYQSTEDFLKEFNKMPVDDIDDVFSSNRYINKILEEDYSTDKIEGFDDAVKLNGTRMLKIPNDERIANIFKVVPYIDDIVLRYDKNTKKPYVHVGSSYYEIGWSFDIEPKLSDDNKIVIKKML